MFRFYQQPTFSSKSMSQLSWQPAIKLTPRSTSSPKLFILPKPIRLESTLSTFRIPISSIPAFISVFILSAPSQHCNHHLHCYRYCLNVCMISISHYYKSLSIKNNHQHPHNRRHSHQLHRVSHNNIFKAIIPIEFCILQQHPLLMS